jgi:hypothetical protein
VERDLEGKIVNKRQKNATNLRQLQRPWSVLCSFKTINKRGVGEKRFVLAVQYDTHKNHQLVDDPFIFPRYLKSSEEFQEAYHQTVKHCSQVFSYSVSRRLIEIRDPTHRHRPA